MRNRLLISVLLIVTMLLTACVTETVPPSDTGEVSGATECVISETSGGNTEASGDAGYTQAVADTVGGTDVTSDVDSTGTAAPENSHPGTENAGTGDIQTPAETTENLTFDVDVPEDSESDFVMETSDGMFSQDGNIYTITAAGTYDCYGALYEGRILVCAPDDAKVVINLNGCKIVNSSAAPVSALTADEVDISAKKSTENSICDLRSVASEETSEGGAVYAECDLTLKGGGSLEIIANCNHGVHTKDDLKLKNLTLTVKSVNHALKGNDSVTIESGTIVAVSTGGDAIKTSSTDLSAKGEQRGKVEIIGGTVTLYAACDGIDAASDVVISGDAVVHIFTDSYSPYSGDIMTGGESTIYLRLTSTVYNANYKYAAYFYNTDGSYVWKDLSFYKQSTSASQTGRPGGFGGHMGGTTYYYYSVNRPAGYTNVLFYAYTSSQTPGQSQAYTAVSKDNTTLSSARDTYVVSSISGGTIQSSGWTNYQSSQGNSGLAYSCKGIKAGNTISIEGGTVTIKAKDDGLHANFDVVLEATGQKGLGNVMISGGTLTVTSDDDGIHADQDLVISGGMVNIITSYEGLEANRIYISDGAVTVYAKDDGINANSKGAYTAYVEISGGTVDIAVPSGDTDTMDSNGSILISGGYVFLKNGQTGGSSMAGGTIDTDRGVTVTGGTVVSIGCIGDKITGSIYSTSQSFSAGGYTIKDSAGHVIADFTLTSSYKACMFWSDKFVSGQTYTIYRDGETLTSFTKS